MHTTILVEGRQVGIDASDAVLHTQGEFCGNLDVPLTFDHPISTETVIKHLRIKLFNSDDLYDALAHGEKAGGLEVIFSILDDPSLDPFPPDKIPNMVELLWVEENVPTRLGEVTVQTVAEEPDTEPNSPDGPSGGSGCAAVLLAVVSGLLLLSGLTGCPSETPTAPMISKTTPLPGCRVRSIDDAEFAVSQLSCSDAHVFKIDGDLATCKFEILYRPDEDSEETLLYSVTGDVVAHDAQLMKITKPHDNHLFLAIQVPEYPPKPDDDIVFAFSIPGRTIRDAKKAKEIFPDLVLAYDGPHGALYSPMKECHVEPGEEAIVADYQHSWREQEESGGGAMSKRGIVRYRVTVTCLKDGKLPDRGDGSNGQDKDEGKSK